MADKQKADRPKKQTSKRTRYAIFVTLDEDTEKRLNAFLARQRIRPDRAAVALTALIEFLDREERKH